MFGPTPRDYSFKLNKKVKKLAKKSALSAKAAEKQIKVLEDFNFESPWTSSILKQLQGPEKKRFPKICSNIPIYSKRRYSLSKSGKNSSKKSS